MVLRKRVMSAALCLGVAATLLTGPAYAEGERFPSGAEVERARGDEDRATAELAGIRGALVTIRERSAELGVEAVLAAAEESAAQTALQDASLALTGWENSLGAAQSVERDARQAAALVIASLRRAGGQGSTWRLIQSDDPEALLDRLGRLERVSLSSQRALDRAERARGEVDALTAQAAQVRRERVVLADAAATARDRAAASAQEADAAVDQVQAKESTLLAQMAVLAETSAATEAAYIESLVTPPLSSQGPPGGGSGPVIAPPPTGNAPATDPASARAYASSRLGAFGWGQDQFGCLVNLWNRESGWRYTATNPQSGAYGIPQAWPAGKLAQAGADWRTNPQTQIEWGLDYIRDVYRTPCRAWAHSETVNWY